MSARRWSAVWGLLVAATGLYLFSDNEADNDLWVHVRLGLELLAGGVPRADTWSYTAAGSPLVDHEWLLHALLGGLYRAAGGPALLLFKLMAALATLAVLASSVARHATSVHVRGAVLVLATAVLARGFAIRPQVVTYLGMALLWAFLDRPEWRDSARRWWLVPAFVLWANLHGGALVGFAACGLCAAWLLLERPGAGVRLAVVVAVAAAASLALNPYGLAYAGFLQRELAGPHPITEWQPVAIEGAQATFLALAAAFLAILPFLGRWRARGWQMALAALLLAAALRQQRHTPLFALCAAPLVAEGTERLLARLRARSDWRLSAPAQSLLAVGLAGLALLQLALAGARLAADRMQVVFAPAEYPVEAVRRLRANEAPLNLALPLEWGGYAAWWLGPRVRVSLDGRFAMVYPPAVVEDNFAFFSGREGWRHLLERHPTQAVLAPAAALPPVAGSAEWREVHRDAVAVLLVRRDQSLALAPAAAPPAAPMPFP